MSLHESRCLQCGYPMRLCICTEAEYRAWAAARDAQEAAERAAYYGKQKPVKVAEDEFRDLGHKSGSAYLLSWDLERQAEE